MKLEDMLDRSILPAFVRGLQRRDLLESLVAEINKVASTQEKRYVVTYDDHGRYYYARFAHYGRRWERELEKGTLFETLEEARHKAEILTPPVDAVGVSVFEVTLSTSRRVTFQSKRSMRPDFRGMVLRWSIRDGERAPLREYDLEDR